MLADNRTRSTPVPEVFQKCTPGPRSRQADSVPPRECRELWSPRDAISEVVQDPRGMLGPLTLPGRLRISALGTLGGCPKTPPSQEALRQGTKMAAAAARHS